MTFALYTPEDNTTLDLVVTADSLTGIREELARLRCSSDWMLKLYLMAEVDGRAPDSLASVVDLLDLARWCVLADNEAAFGEPVAEPVSAAELDNAHAEADEAHTEGYGDGYRDGYNQAKQEAASGYEPGERHTCSDCGDAFINTTGPADTCAGCLVARRADADEHLAHLAGINQPQNPRIIIESAGSTMVVKLDSGLTVTVGEGDGRG